MNLRLEALDSTGVHSLLESLLGDAIPNGLEEFVTARSAGNPFFLQELVRSLQEEEVLVPVDGGWRMRTGWDARTLPATIEEVLSARFDALPRPAAALLQTVSVIGRRVSLPLLDAVSEGLAEIEPSLARLLESGLLERGRDGGEDVVIFHHALVQDAAYSRLLRRQRRTLHLRVAEVAESLYGAGDETIDLLARHLYLGEAGEKAAEYLVRAGPARGDFSQTPRQFSTTAAPSRSHGAMPPSPPICRKSCLSSRICASSSATMTRRSSCTQRSEMKRATCVHGAALRRRSESRASSWKHWRSWTRPSRRTLSRAAICGRSGSSGDGRSRSWDATTRESTPSRRA